MYPNLALTIVGLVFMCFMPESPRYLVAKKQFDKARQVFAKIAKTNCAKVNVNSLIFEGEFDQEPEAPLT
jgi:hypothetical protein